MSTDAQDDQGAELVSVDDVATPAHSAAAGPSAQPAGAEVVDAELVEADQPVPVDPRPVKPAPAWRRGEPTRHPIVAPWLRQRESRRAAGRWALRFVWHQLAFHGARLPLYVLALAAYAPAGAVRLARSVARWVSDADSRPLRAAAVDGKLFKEHEKLQEDRDRRIKVRALGLLAAALAGAAGWGTYEVLTQFASLGPVAATGAAAIVVGAASGLLRRGGGVPPLVVTLAGITPLLPGFTAYRGFYQLAVEGVAGGLVTVTVALGIGLALAAGVAFGDFLTRPHRTPVADPAPDAGPQ